MSAPRGRDRNLELLSYQNDRDMDHGRSSAEYNLHDFHQHHHHDPNIIHHHHLEETREPIVSTSRGGGGSEEAREQHGSIQRNAIGQLSAARRTLPVLAIIYLVWNLIEIVAFSTILALTWHQPCDEPTIRAVIIARIVRDGMVLPVHLRRVLGYEETTFDHRIQTINRIAILFFFIFAQQWLTDGKVCREQAPGLYWTGIAIIILLWLTILAPILLLIGICLCLPCLLGVFRVLNIGTGLPEALSNNDLDNLPTFEYDPATYHEASFNHQPGDDFEMIEHADAREGDEDDKKTDDNHSTPRQPEPQPKPVQPTQPDLMDSGTAPTLEALSPQPVPSRHTTPSHHATPTQHATPSRSRWKTPKMTGSAPEADFAPARPPAVTEAVAGPECSICLCPFERTEVISKLRCAHTFHRDCVKSWLQLNRTCPICRKDAITGVAQDVNTSRRGLTGLF